LKDKFINKTSKVFLTKPESTPLSFNTYDVSSELRFSYLESDELSSDFSILESSFPRQDENTKSSKNSVITSLFGNSSYETPHLNPIFLDKPINAYICIYSINSIITPFFEYLFNWNKESKHSEFPKKIINLQLTPTTEDDSTKIVSTPSIKIQIMNECIEYIVDLFNLHSQFDTNLLNKIFKGFILKSESNSIYLFFNGTDFDYSNVFSTKGAKEPATKNPEATPLFKKGILDEIINKQSIGKTPILPEIVNLFKENSYINTIYFVNKHNSLIKNPIIYPLCLYLCTNDKQIEDPERFSWTNVSIDVRYDEETVDFPILGDFYYFSSNFLIDESSKEEEKLEWKMDKYKKYAVFLDINNGEYPIEESYIVKDLSTINKEQLDNYFQKINPANVSTIWFKYNDLQLWGIKYPNQFICINTI